MNHRASCQRCDHICNRTVLPAVYCDETYRLIAALPGFEHVREISAVCRPEIEPFFAFKATHEKDLSLVCIDPFLVCPDYEPRVSDLDLAQLGLAKLHDAILVATAVVPDNPAEATANLRAPIVLNRRRRVAKQILCSFSQLSSRFPIGHVFRTRRTPSPTLHSPVTDHLNVLDVTT